MCLYFNLGDLDLLFSEKQCYYVIVKDNSFIVHRVQDITEVGHLWFE